MQLADMGRVRAGAVLFTGQFTDSPRAPILPTEEFVLMFRLLGGKRAKLLGAALIMASTLAAVNSPASLAAAESSIPSFLDPSKLPICEKPGPQKPSFTPPKSVHDPAAYHCAITPARAGLQLKGVDNNEFLR